MNEALTITGAILAVLTALVFKRKDVADLKADMRENNAGLRASVGELKSEMQVDFARVEARFERFEARMEKCRPTLTLALTGCRPASTPLPP